VLLCHRSLNRSSYPDVWDFPGGHVEAGEAPLDALSRELLEEIGVSVRTEILPEAPDLHVLYEDLDFSVWIVRSWDGDPVNTAPDEHDEIEWVDIDRAALRRLAHPAYEQWLGTLRQPG
jgi:8-oxo-dGTP diphosphatase